MLQQRLALDDRNSSITSSAQAGDGQASAEVVEIKNPGDPGDGAQEADSLLDRELRRQVQGVDLESQRAEQVRNSIRDLELDSGQSPLGCIMFLGFPFASVAPFHFPACTWAEPCVWKGCCLKLLREQLSPTRSRLSSMCMLRNVRSIGITAARQWIRVYF